MQTNNTTTQNTLPLNETLEQYAASVKDNLISNYGKGNTNDGDIIPLIVNGANWQKKQDEKQLAQIREALEDMTDIAKWLKEHLTEAGKIKLDNAMMVLRDLKKH